LVETIGRHRVTLQYRTLLRWHIWLGWLIGVPLILWTASGLFMAARPIDEVRGTQLNRDPLALAVSAPVAPKLTGVNVEKLVLEQRANGPEWIIQYINGDSRRARVSDGALLPPITANEAAILAKFYYQGTAKPVTYTRFPANKAPLELRKNQPSWRITYDDGTHLYLHADSGTKLAIRTRYWRVYDFMWGLHIMDLQTREDSSHPILIGFAGIAFLALLMAFWMLIARQRRRAERL
jgi:hypothetical protein